MPTDARTQAIKRLRGIARAQRDEPAAILAALDAGIEQKDIADELGCTRERIRLIVRRERPETARKRHDDTPAGSNDGI